MNIKLLAIAGAVTAALAFAAGWKVSGWRQDAASYKALAQAEKEHGQAVLEYDRKLAAAEANAGTLSTTLAGVRARARSLQQEIDNAKLAEPDAPNPVTDEFVRLWHGGAEAGAPAQAPADPSGSPDPLF
jgi:hypothetical protein